MSSEEKERDLNTGLVIIFIIASGIAIAIICVYLYANYYNGDIITDHSRWGEFGDYIGGVLNPVFGFFGLFALLLTISIQVKELQLTRKELRNSSKALESQNETLKLQNFENSFFQMLRLHNDIVNSIDFVRGGGNRAVVTTSGRDCFPVMVQRLSNALKPNKENIEDLETVINIYEKFYEEHQVELGHYFRYLYNIFKFIKNSEIENKRFYSNLVRAQISNHEGIIIFYNCLSKYGNKKFHPLVVEFSILKNIPRSLLFHESHQNWYPDISFE
ncbi:MAG TPA: hypothetical protein EYQ42_02955 [Thiotrichaceae bacterium]|jgi:hypothetical protein|nr:hypothetical protein [Thiotrichaceae bacterium]HIM08431.1 hypothetical protein [Gammaproteobacteria bacterium]